MRTMRMMRMMWHTHHAWPKKGRRHKAPHLHICSLGHPPRHICLSPAFKAESIIGAQAALHQQHARWYNRCLPSGPKHRPLCIYMCVCMCAALKTFKHKPTGANQPNVHHKLEEPCEEASSHRQNLPDIASIAQDFRLIDDLSERQGLQNARIKFFQILSFSIR